MVGRRPESSSLDLAEAVAITRWRVGFGGGRDCVALVRGRDGKLGRGLASDGGGPLDQDVSLFVMILVLVVGAAR